ncbi:uncharacterized protein LOC119919322 [Micropterus salmoides]|uniref:uncharacterized protein LOC119919322 n=1 Tax=Micropterus salmoides TaxID=27706 RepID=UPI0018EB005D|nr:uncharacterized protein LOC119919322 [Micropterus salmoides]
MGCEATGVSKVLAEFFSPCAEPSRQTVLLVLQSPPLDGAAGGVAGGAGAGFDVPRQHLSLHPHADVTGQECSCAERECNNYSASSLRSQLLTALQAHYCVNKESSATKSNAVDRKCPVPVQTPLAATRTLSQGIRSLMAAATRARAMEASMIKEAITKEETTNTGTRSMAMGMVMVMVMVMVTDQNKEKNTQIIRKVNRGCKHTRPPDVL